MTDDIDVLAKFDIDVFKGKVKMVSVSDLKNGIYKIDKIYLANEEVKDNSVFLVDNEDENNSILIYTKDDLSLYMQDSIKYFVRYKVESDSSICINTYTETLNEAELQLRNYMNMFIDDVDNKINLLDHGFIRLVDSMGSDLSIARNARVSYNAEWRAGEDTGSDTRLINYLIENGHNTPVESVKFTFEVKAPIFVFRQWHRHRTWSYNEVSARYTELPEEFYIPEPHLIGKQNAHNKQMRDVITKEQYEDLSLEEKDQVAEVIQTMIITNSESFKAYKKMIEKGVPRELARGVLPVATYSHMFATIDLHNLMNFLRERLHPHAQYEIRVYAEAMLKLIEPIVPVAVAAYKKKYNW